MSADALTPRAFPSLEALAEVVGEQIGRSAWHSIDQGDIDQFATLTRDTQWIHVDVAAAEAGPFGAPIAHGYLTLALIPALSFEAYHLGGVTAQVNYGTDRVRFPAPLVVGSQVRGVFELTAVRPGSSGTQIHVRATVEVAGQDKPACVADTITLVPA